MNRTDIRRLPKALLHDHLDGGLRPATVVDLAADIGYPGLPSDDPAELVEWFDQRTSGSLGRYLDAFAHTVAVMQTAESLERVACEAIEDLAADGVVYAELRFAPSLHTDRGLDRSDVIAAVLAGLRAGSQASGVSAGVIVAAMRQDDDSQEVALAAAGFANAGVVGFDLAGPENGFPPGLHDGALAIAREAGLRLTLHAGEAAGPDSISAALDCGAERIGHGVRIIDDCVVEDGAIAEAGPVATRIILQDTTLEICPTSNIGTGVFASLAAHPIGMLHRAGFPVTVSTDNRLMSRTSLSEEFSALVEHHGFDRGDIHRLTRRAVEAAFCSEGRRKELLDRIDTAYSAS